MTDSLETVEIKDCWTLIKDPKDAFLEAHGDAEVAVLVGAGEGVKHTFTVRELSVSKLAMTMLLGDPEARELVFEQIDPDVMELVGAFLRRHNGVAPRSPPKPILKGSATSTYIDHPDDVALIDLHGADYMVAPQFRLMLAANYLDIQPLLNMCLAKVAVVAREQSDLPKMKAALAPPTGKKRKAPEEEEKEAEAEAPSQLKEEEDGSD